MNKIYVDIDFTNGILEKKGIDLITGDYASTEIEFTFDESHSTGRKVFEMKSPSNELVIVKEIENNKVLLASKDENQNNVSLFDESGYYIFEVSYYDNDSKLTSVYGKIPVEQEQVVIDGEVVTPYLPIFDQLIQDLNNKIDEVDTKLEEVDTKLDNIDTALENVNTAIEETNNLDINVSDKVNKEVTITLTKKDNTTKSVKINDGVSLQFMWQGTSLGIKTDDMQDYVFVNLQGIQGLPGPQGEPFRIKKTYPSVQAMQDDFNNMQYGDYVMIASSVEVEDNAKLYTRGESQWIFITDFSGATGIRGPVGATPNIQIGNVTSGSTPSVTRTGTDENPILNFVLEKGEKGDKPVKGVDYFTAQDKQEIVSEVTEDATSTFNQNVTAKTTQFNSNASEKLSNYNSNAESKLNEYNTNAESKLNDYNSNAVQKTTEFNTNAQEKTDEFNANKEKLQQELERYKLIENALPHVTGSGESVTLDNTANAGMTIDLEPNTSQESTPSPDYPQDIHVVSGDNTLKVENKNLIPTKEFTLHRTNKRTIQIDFEKPLTAGTYTISWKITNQSGLTSSAPFGWALYNGSTNVGWLPQIYSGVTTTTSTKVTTEQITYLYGFINSSAPSDATITLDEIQIESGDTATDYEPHEEQTTQLNLGDLEYCEIGDYKDEFIRNSGKNLFNPSNVSNRYINDDNGNVTGDSNSQHTDYIAVEGSKDYYILSSKTSGNWGAWYDASKQYISGITLRGNNSGIVTSPSNAKYMRFTVSYINNNPNYANNVMIAKSSTEIPYEPYGSNKWYLKKKIGKVVLDGNTNISGKGYELTNSYRFYTAVMLPESINGISLSNYFKNDFINNINTVDSPALTVINQKQIILRIDKTLASTEAELSTWLSTHNTTVYYVLATPTYILLNSTLQTELNNIQKLLGYQNQTNITQVNNDLPFTISASALKDISNL